MKMFNKVTIIGVGLIGGSIGLAVRKKRLAKEVVGVCRHQRSLVKAKQIGAIDRGFLDYHQALRDADLVILAMPVKQIIQSVRSILPNLKKNCLLTDVGSTKSEIVRCIERVLPQDIFFVGAHPMAGSEKRGVASARANLFQAALCILTPTKKTNPEALKKVARFWQALGSRIKVLSPEKHDQAVALISHLPHLAATQLVKVAQKDLAFAASGFWDTTRIASSDAEIWTEIFLTNKKFVLAAIDEYVAQLKLMRKLIQQNKRKQLSAVFRKAKTLRDAWQK